MEASAILQPVIVVALLTVVMTIWMIATRAPAMAKHGIDYQEVQEFNFHSIESLREEGSRFGETPFRNPGQYCLVSPPASQPDYIILDDSQVISP